MRKEWLFVLLFALLLVCSCSRGGEEAAKGTSLSPDSARGNAPPAVVSAAVMPHDPNASTPLNVQYSGEDREGEFIQYEFRWFVDNVLVQQGAASVLEPGSYFSGSEVYVEIIPSDSHSSGKPFLTPKVTIGNNLPSLSSVAVSPEEAAVGATLSATAEGADPDGDDVEYAYQWFVNGKAATERQDVSTFTTKGLKKNDLVYVTVVPSDKEGSGEVMASNIVKLMNGPPVIQSKPQYHINAGIYTYRVTAKDPDNDRLTYSLETSPQGMTINASTGLVRWEVPKQSAEREEVFVKIVVDDGDGGSATQEFSLILNP